MKSCPVVHRSLSMNKTHCSSVIYNIVCSKCFPSLLFHLLGTIIPSITSQRSLQHPLGIDVYKVTRAWRVISFAVPSGFSSNLWPVRSHSFHQIGQLIASVSTCRGVEVLISSSAEFTMLSITTLSHPQHMKDFHVCG